MAHMDLDGCLYEDYDLEEEQEKEKEKRNLEYEVNIDFDEASKAWMANKKSTGNGSYKYICEQKTQMGEPCKREPKKGFSYCSIHVKNNKKLNIVKQVIKQEHQKIILAQTHSQNFANVSFSEKLYNTTYMCGNN